MTASSAQLQKKTSKQASGRRTGLCLRDDHHHPQQEEEGSLLWTVCIGRMAGAGMESRREEMKTFNQCDKAEEVPASEHSLVSFEMIQQGPLISSQFKYILNV